MYGRIGPRSRSSWMLPRPAIPCPLPVIGVVGGPPVAWASLRSKRWKLKSMRGRIGRNLRLTRTKPWPLNAFLNACFASLTGTETPPPRPTLMMRLDSRLSIWADAVETIAARPNATSMTRGAAFIRQLLGWGTCGPKPTRAAVSHSGPQAGCGFVPVRAAAPPPDLHLIEHPKGVRFMKGPIPPSWSPRLLSVLRIVAAFLFMAHGAQKLFGFPAPLGFPLHSMSLPWFAGVIEVVGGGLLLIGLFTRPAAFLVSGEMAVAYFKGHAPGGFWPLLNHVGLAV